MKVAWVTAYDAQDLRAYGTRGYYEPKSLQEQSISVDYIGPLKMPKSYQLLFYIKHRLHENRFMEPSNRRWYSTERSPLLLKDYARQISRKLSKLNDVDIVCSGPTPWSQPVAYLECDQPIVIWTDGIFASVIDFYPTFFRNVICQESINDGITNEKSALRRCKLLIYASEWAAQSAIAHYQIDPSIIRIVPWGPNFECNNTLDDIKRIIDSRSTNSCKLLFFGRDWFRKRGDIAIQVVKELNRAGVKAELTVVGDYPYLGESNPSFIKLINPIDKTVKADLNLLFKLLAESHFLILPTIADASPYALPEAGAFGLPCVTTDVGGIPTMIRDDLNGKKFSVNASIEDYCSYISNLFSNYSQYKKLALSSFHEYETRLNWSVAGQTVKKLLTELII
jgi:glycosyltransferase involved in cell wall biosynthesis